MSIIFDSQGYFCEGEIDYMWQDKMKFGHIILTNEALIFEGGSQLDYNLKYTEGFKVTIPLDQIKKGYKSKTRLVHVVIVETIDDCYFTITFATGTSLGKKNAKQLDLLLNKVKPKSSPIGAKKFCTNCGNKISPSSKFCINCGIQLN